jgi:hypothetical protein
MGTYTLGERIKNSQNEGNKKTASRGKDYVRRIVARKKY